MKDTGSPVRVRTVCVLTYDTLLESYYCAYLCVSLFTTASGCLVASADLTTAGDCAFLFLVFNYPSCLSSCLFMSNIKNVLILLTSVTKVVKNFKRLSILPFSEMTCAQFSTEHWPGKPSTNNVSTNMHNTVARFNFQ